MAVDCHLTKHAPTLPLKMASVPLRRSRTSLFLFIVLGAACTYFVLPVLVVPLQTIMPTVFEASSSSSSTRPSYHGYTSAFSFDLNETTKPDWMARIPDDTSLASLSIPGTHDTMTFDLVDNEGYQCQNHDLTTQLHAGLRYLDVRSRLVYRRRHQDGEPPLIGIYHGYAYTGYTFQDVLLTVFAFLDAHPTEGIIMRIKEEGPPVPTNGDKPEDEDRDDFTDTTAEYNTTFEQAFHYYRTTNPITSPGCAAHFLLQEEKEEALPTMRQLRNRILILYEFPTTTNTSVPGIPWTSPDHIALEDLWIIADPAHLDDKWTAVRANLVAAAAGDGKTNDALLFLTHLSASVGVLPIEAAAGPIGERNRNGSSPGGILGINERTGTWLEKGGGGGGKTGVVSKCSFLLFVHTFHSCARREWLALKLQD